MMNSCLANQGVFVKTTLIKNVFDKPVPILRSFLDALGFTRKQLLYRYEVNNDVAPLISTPIYERTFRYRVYFNEEFFFDRRTTPMITTDPKINDLL